MVGFIQKTHDFWRPFFFGCLLGIFLVGGVLVAERYHFFDILFDDVYAASGIIRPNGNGNTNDGTPTTCDGGGTAYECLDDPETAPGAPATTTEDYLVQVTGDADFFQMDNSITDVATVTAITIYTYHQEGGTNMSLDVSLWNAAESTQIATTTTYTNRNSAADWDAAVIGGLSLTQSDLTGLRVRLGCTKGAGKGSDCTSYVMYADITYDQAIDLTVSSVGSQRARIGIASSSAYVGGAFVISDSSGNSRDITSIAIEETGSVDANNDLYDIRLYYENAADCSAASFDGTEALYDAATTFSGNVATFSDTGIGVTPTLDLCLYPVIGVSTTAQYGDTLALRIADPSSDVIGSGGAIVEPNTSIEIIATTTLERADLNQVAYHWRQDNGDEGDTVSGADSATGGATSTPIGNGASDQHYRLRMAVTNQGNATSSATQYRLEYATKVSNCSTLDEGDWVDVHATADDWDMVNSNDAGFNDGNTTNIANFSKGAIDDYNTSFDGSGAARETTSLSGSITLDPTEFTELEYSLNASSTIVDGTTYCFRVTNNGTPLLTYNKYPEITFTADVTVSAEESQPTTISIPTTGVYLGAFSITNNTGSHDIDEITITASSTVSDVTTAFANIELYYENDASNPYICDGITYDGGETQYGGVAGQTNASFSVAGTSTFTGGAGTTPTVTQTSAVCLYVVMDVTSSAIDGDTLDIKIESPSSDVVVSAAGTVAPAAVVPLTGVTTLTAPYLDQVHFHWRQDNGTEATASSSVGDEDVNFDELPDSTVQRLRFGIANTGGETSGNFQYQLEWAQKTSDCSLVSDGSWNDIDTGGDEWSVVASQLVDNGNTTNISTTTGGVTNVGTFLATNGGQQDSDGVTNNIDLPAGGWLELEYSIQANNTVPEGATYCFRVTNNGTKLDAYTRYPEATIKLGTDFAVTRNSFSMTGTSTILREGIDYTLQYGSSSRAFIRLTNTHHTGGGPAAGSTGNHNSDDVTAYIENPGNIENHVVIRRTTGAPVNDTRVSWEVVEYLGEIGGENEIYVHDAGVISVTGTNLTGTTAAVPGGVTNDGNIVPWITGQYNSDTGRANYNYGLFTSAWNSGADTMTVTRGEGGSDAAVSYAIIEFRGSNWNVYRVQEDYQQDPGVEDTTSFGPLQTADITKAFIHAQHQVANGQDDHASIGHEVWLSSFGAVSFRLNGALPAGDIVDHVSVAWVIENIQSAGKIMKVQRKANSIAAGGGGLTTVNVTLDNEIDDITTASLLVNNSNSNTARTFPEPMISAQIISTTQFQLQVSDDTGENLYRAEVVEWPTAAAKIIQNDFWLYEDDDNPTPSTPWSGLNENDEMTANDSPIASGQNIRIRMSLTVTAASLPAGVDTYRLEYSKRTSTCGNPGNVWYQLGDAGSTTALWRANNATPVDGSEVSTSFILTESTVAGSYEEENDTAININQALVNDVVEYDWNIQDNGADDKSDYCFRMVYANGNTFESYSTYPVIRTVGYGPEVGDWKWFDDETNVTPITELAATNTAPIDITFDDPIKLRTIITEKSGAAGNPAKFKLQYSEYANFSQGVYDVASSTLCTASSTWCYFDGAGVDNATITANTLSGITGSCSLGVGAGCGTHNESISSTTATLVQPAYSSQEFEFTIVHAGARANAVYYFRLFNVVDNEIVPASSTYPSLVTEGASLVSTINSVFPGVSTEGIVSDGTSTPTTIQFGSVPPNTPYEVVHRLSINTNATEGYKVLMYADQPLTNTYGGTIPDFPGTNAAPLGWVANCPGNCFGYHAGDDLLEGGDNRFAADDSYAAVSTTTPEEVMYSSVPVNESHDIVYKIQVDELQPAGNYEAAITYFAIPVF